MSGRESGELAEVAAGFDRRVELRAHQIVVPGQLAVPHFKFLQRKLRLELDGVGVVVSEGHVDAAVSAVSSQHESLGQFGSPARYGEAFSVQGGDERYSDIGEGGVGVSFLGDPQLSESELVAAGGFYDAAEGAGEKLRSEADTQDRLPSICCRPEILHFPLQRGKVVVSRHGPAKRYDDVNLTEVRRVEIREIRLTLEHGDSCNLIPQLAQNRAEIRSQCLESVVLYNYGVVQLMLASSGPSYPRFLPSAKLIQVPSRAGWLPIGTVSLIIQPRGVE